MPTDTRALDPPLREAWSINTHGLIEFPPAVADGVAYVVNKFGNLRAVTLRDHRTVWKTGRDPKNSGKPTDVTAPVYTKVALHRLHRRRTGRPRSEDAGDRIGSAISTPISNPRRWSSTGTSTSAPTRRSWSRWMPPTAGEVAIRRRRARSKRARATTTGASSSPTTRGRCTRSTPSTGKRCGAPTRPVKPVRQGAASTPRPAIDFGRVYAARDDGTIYAFDERTGKVDWYFPTHNFIYGSPALAQVPGTPPTVYIGSYDEHLYALDAPTGKQRWKYDVGGPMPGTSTVIGNTVYTTSFKTRKRSASTSTRTEDVRASTRPATRRSSPTASICI